MKLMKKEWQRFAGWITLGGMSATVVMALTDQEHTLDTMIVWLGRGYGDIYRPVVFGMIFAAILYGLTQRR